MIQHYLFLSLMAPCLVGCAQQATRQFVEGKDYQIFERVRLMDTQGFTEPQEAGSILLPKGWHCESKIIWKAPGTTGAGTYSSVKASSPDKSIGLEIFPDCLLQQQLNAEQYLRQIFAREIGDAEVIKVEENPGVVRYMQQYNAQAEQELMRYGAGRVSFDQSAINAELRWADGTRGLVTVGITTIENIVPNIYTGGANTIYTTQATKRTLFRFPAADLEKAKNQFAVIMSGIRTNPAWQEAVKKFWRDAREQSHIAHVGRIRMMDEQTRRMGEQAIRSGQERLKNMDTQLRSWERQQSSQDHMHTEFIKTIREVENYRDETGKYEMSAGYDHVWSRGDGNSFILSNSSSFDPSAVFLDQNWKEMKKVH